MSEQQFTSSPRACARWRMVARDGAIAFVCMDWRHMGELLAAGRSVFSELKNLCVWNKSNGGMGTFYRSKHELVFVWKVGRPLISTALAWGMAGRYRTNVSTMPASPASAVEAVPRNWRCTRR